MENAPFYGEDDENKDDLFDPEHLDDEEEEEDELDQEQERELDEEKREERESFWRRLAQIAEGETKAEDGAEQPEQIEYDEIAEAAEEAPEEVAELPEVEPIDEPEPAAEGSSVEPAAEDAVYTELPIHETPVVEHAAEPEPTEPSIPAAAPVPPIQETVNDKPDPVEPPSQPVPQPEFAVPVVQNVIRETNTVTHIEHVPNRDMVEDVMFAGATGFLVGNRLGHVIEHENLRHKDKEQAKKIKKLEKESKNHEKRLDNDDYRLGIIEQAPKAAVSPEAVLTNEYAPNVSDNISERRAPSNLEAFESMTPAEVALVEARSSEKMHETIERKLDRADNMQGTIANRPQVAVDSFARDNSPHGMLQRNPAMPAEMPVSPQPSKEKSLSTEAGDVLYYGFITLATISIALLLYMIISR